MLCTRTKASKNSQNSHRHLTNYVAKFLGEPKEVHSNQLQESTTGGTLDLSARESSALLSQAHNLATAQHRRWGSR